MDVIKENPMLGHITTFGGHPVSCAAALAAVEVLETENLLSPVPEKEKRFRKNLRHPAIKSISGKGLMLAVEMESFDFVQKVIHHCLELGLLTDWFLFNDRCLRIAPPLIIINEEIDEACEIILSAIDHSL